MSRPETSRSWRRTGSTRQQVGQSRLTTATSPSGSDGFLVAGTGILVPCLLLRPLTGCEGSAPGASLARWFFFSLDSAERRLPRGDSWHVLPPCCLGQPACPSHTQPL